MAAEPNLFPDQKKLVLLDGMALVYRAHFALIRSPRYTSGGLCTSAVFGMANTVLDIIKKENPTHIAAAFDTSEPTERHKVFPAYKAQRDALPEDIGLQLPYVDRLLEAFNITVIRIPGYEADDIIGTMAHQATDQAFRTLMVTPDKDYHQLVSDDVVIFRPGRKGAAYETLGVPEVLEHWNIRRVDQVIDILGLMGDASDNIPGVPGHWAEDSTEVDCRVRLHRTAAATYSSTEGQAEGTSGTERRNGRLVEAAGDHSTGCAA